MTDNTYQGRDYSYLKDTYVELTRTDEEYNEGRLAKVLEVKNDCLRVEVNEGGDIFWTDIDSVSYEPDTRKHKIRADEEFFNRFKRLKTDLENLIGYFQNEESEMSPWEIDGWNHMAGRIKSELSNIIKEANQRMWNK